MINKTTGESTKYSVHIPAIGLRIMADSLEDLSRQFCEARDASDMGVSLFGCEFQIGGARGLRLSYNGKIWFGLRCVLDPYATLAIEVL